MTLDQEFATYQGKSVLVPGEPESERGQCVQWADYVLHDVYGLPYHYGNAIDWWNNPKELLTENFVKITDGSVLKGDFVVFNTSVGSVYGHIDVAMQNGITGNYQGSDSNWGGNLTVHLVQHNNASQVLGSLRRKEDIMTKAEAYTVTDGFYRWGTDAPPTPQQSEYWADRLANVASGLDELYQAMKKQAEAPPNVTVLKPGIYKAN